MGLPSSLFGCGRCKDRPRDPAADFAFWRWVGAGVDFVPPRFPPPPIESAAVLPASYLFPLAGLHILWGGREVTCRRKDGHVTRVLSPTSFSLRLRPRCLSPQIICEGPRGSGVHRILCVRPGDCLKSCL